MSLTTIITGSSRVGSTVRDHNCINHSARPADVDFLQQSALVCFFLKEVGRRWTVGTSGGCTSQNIDARQRVRHAPARARNNTHLNPNDRTRRRIWRVRAKRQLTIAWSSTRNNKTAIKETRDIGKRWPRVWAGWAQWLTTAARAPLELPHSNFKDQWSMR